MEENASFTFEEYLNLILGNEDISFSTLNKLNLDQLNEFKERVDRCLRNFSNFNFDSKFSKDEETFLLKLAELAN